MTQHSSLVGCTGVLEVATRGEDGPGEVLVSVWGGSEAYMAYSEQPLDRHSQVLVIGTRGSRGVDVVPWEGLPGADVG